MHREYTDTCSTDRLYHLLAHRSGAVYVAGNLTLLPRGYDPMSCMAEIIMSLIDIGAAYSRGEDSSYAVQAFCCHYGLLGFSKALVEKEYDDHSVKFYAGNVLGLKAATAKEYDTLFDPFPDAWTKQRRRTVKERVAELIIDRDGAVSETMPDYYECEAVEWYGRYGAQIYELLRKKQSGEATVLIPGNAELRYEVCGEHTRRRWYFDSLKSACDAWLMEMLTEPYQAIRLCKHCGKVFLAKDKRVEYCSASCRNVANVSNSRKRKNGQR